MAQVALGERPYHFAFLLIPGFSLISFAAALEALRTANRCHTEPLFTWEVLSVDGEPVEHAGGVEMPVDDGLHDLAHRDTVLVCASFGVQKYSNKTLFAWLRRQDRLGVNLGGICTASYVLARAGLLDNHRCCIHWENLAAFREQFPELDISPMLFEIGNRRFTSAGGTAPIDMILAIVYQVAGRGAALALADRIIHTAPRDSLTQQRMPLAARIGTRHPKLTRLVEMMEASIEEPMSVARLAEEAEITPRQVERLFQRYLGYSPKKYYLNIRLHRARQLLLLTDRPVMDIAIACGFTTSSHFARCYRGLFGCSPLSERSLSAEASGEGVDVVKTGAPAKGKMDGLKPVLRVGEPELPEDFAEVVSVSS